MLAMYYTNGTNLQ